VSSNDAQAASAQARDAERRAGQALRTMADEERLSLREAVEWCGGSVTVREITRLLQRSLGRSRRTRRISGRPGRAGRRLRIVRPSAGLPSTVMGMSG
jgi:hypothetical protein